MMKEKFMKVFGRLEDPSAIDWVLVGVMAIATASFISMIYIIATHNG